MSKEKPCPWLLPALSHLHHLIIWPSTNREENRRAQRAAVEGLRQQCMHSRERFPFQGCAAHVPQGCNGAGCQHELQGHCMQGWPQPWCETIAKQPLTPPRWSYFLLLPVSFCSVLRHFIPLSYPMREQPCVHSNPVQSQG